MKRRTLMILFLLACLLPACSGKSSVLTAGYDTMQGKRPSPNAAEALASARTVERSWRHEIYSRAARYPQARFPNPSVHKLMGDLRLLAQKYDFTVVSVRLLRPR